jgi:LysR family glycine cleavage system transcriptional activator
MDDLAQPPLNALRVFEAVARHGSFSRAADELCVTQSAVSYQIRLLENWFDGPLFERHGNRAELLPHGVDLARAMALSLGDIDAACRRARRAGAPPKLTVGVIPSVAICWLIPRLAEFRALAPSIDLRIVYAIHGREIDFRDVDVAIVYASGAPDLPAFEAVPFLPGASAPVSSRSFADTHQPLMTVRDFVEAGLLHDTDHTGWETWLKNAGEPGLPFSAGPVFEDFNLLRAAALAGQGVAICPIAIVRDDIEAGRLVLLSDKTILDHCIYFIVSKRSHDNPTTRALSMFREWLLSTTK